MSSSSTGPSNSTTSCVAAADRRARRGAGCGASAPRARRCPTSPVIRRWECSVRPPSKRRNRCLPSASTLVTARPASRSGQRSRAAPRMRRADRVRHVSLEQRADPVRRVVDGVAFGHALWERSGSGYVAHHAGGPRPHRRRRERPAGRRPALRRRPDGVQRGARVGRRRRAARRRRARSRRSSRGATSAASRSSRAAAGPAGRAAPCRSAPASSSALERLSDGARASTRCSGGWTVERGRHDGDRAAPRARERAVLPARPGGGRDVADRRQRRDERRRAALLQVRRHGRVGDGRGGGARAAASSSASAARRARTSRATTCAGCSSAPRERSGSSRRSGCG